ncbi:MAG: hypothetical protein JWP22_3782 [Ramlibacter sp.]|jgi:hypothetical protein|nr:hypothetical protein [Ramlibacter sp.]MDB5915107.1 hypothetical protein [Ramlibacter sp.]
MHLPIAHARKPVPAAYVAAFREGRGCEQSRRMTVRLLFPGLDARPGPWLLLLACVCTLVAVRSLELGLF